MKQFLKSSLTIFVIFLLYKCANIVAPTGGPKDEDPPEMIRSKPEIYSRNYQKKEFELYFNEFIQLKDLQKKLVISPPTENKPQIINKGKSLEIIFEDDLRENTTYTINFADAIVDNNEGNPIPQFEFVFSTGNDIDSLSVSGMVIDVFTDSPIEGVYALLYDNLNDSAPLLEVPYYVSKTNKLGQFTINNVKMDTFRLFILADQNINYIYDLPDEAIGFTDTLVLFSYNEIEITDSISEDSVVTSIQKGYFTKYFTLFTFTEETKLQYLSNNDRPDRRKLEFIFNRPLYDSVRIEPVYFTPTSKWFIKEKHTINDTVVYWLTDTSVINNDTLNVALYYDVLDSADQLITKIDTVYLRFRDRPQSRRRGKKEESEEEKVEELKITSSVKNKGKLPLGSNFVIEVDHPLSSFDTSKINLFQRIDTIESKKAFAIEKHQIYLRKYMLYSDWEPGLNCRLLIEPEAFIDVYGLTNDTIEIQFSTPTVDTYGKLLLNISGIKSPVIVQLLDAKEKVIMQQFTDIDGILTFEYINPSVYKLKLIYDDNGNKIWDTGNYLKKIQPEHVLYFQGEINIRANWDVEQDWNIAE